MPNTILIIDDDSELRAFLVGALTNHGFKAAEVSNASQAEEVAVQVRPMLILLDLGLPDGDGLEVLQKMRARNATTPVIVLSARDQVEDKVNALDLGANDYLTKPFNMRELLARVRVALRHAGQHATTPDPIVNAGPVRIDHERHEITVDGVPTRLTPIEFRLLSTLARNAGKVLTHRQLLEEVWGPGKEAETTTSASTWLPCAARSSAIPHGRGGSRPSLASGIASGTNDRRAPWRRSSEELRATRLAGHICCTNFEHDDGTSPDA